MAPRGRPKIKALVGAATSRTGASGTLDVQSLERWFFGAAWQIRGPLNASKFTQDADRPSAPCLGDSNLAPRTFQGDAMVQSTLQPVEPALP